MTDTAGKPEQADDPVGPPPGPADPAARVKAARDGRYRDALRSRDLRLLVASFLIDQIGSWSYAVVLSVYIFDRTHSTQWLAIAGLCRWGPNLLLASYGGVIADRYQRTTVMIVSALVSAVLMTGMAVAIGTGAPIAYLLVIIALSSVALSPYRPAAGALTPEIVGERDLTAANSIFSGLENLVVVVGPAIGGLLLLTGRPVIGVAINAASFAVAAVIVARLKVRSKGSGSGDGNAWQQFTTGIKALGTQPVALAIMLLATLDTAVYGASTVLYVPLSERLGTGPNGYSYLLAGSALGGVLGVALANRLSSAGRLAPVIMGSIGLQAFPFLLTVPVHSPALAAVLQVLSGVGMVIVDVLAITGLQRDLPGDVLSRVLGVFDTLALGAILLASLLTGILLAHTQVTVALIVVGAGVPVIALFGLPVLLRADRTSAAVARQLRPVVELLSRLDLLAGAERSTLERLAASSSRAILPAGEVVIREGDPADALFVLARGELAVQSSGEDGRPRQLPPVTAPGYVGELGLLHAIPRTATVTTSQESWILRIDGADFLSAVQAGRPSSALLVLAGARMARTPRPVPVPQPWVPESPWAS
ncbi:MAG TPA: MFS transporter [Streptosporangiaceae bacterium]